MTQNTVNEEIHTIGLDLGDNSSTALLGLDRDDAFPGVGSLQGELSSHAKRWTSESDSGCSPLGSRDPPHGLLLNQERTRSKRTHKSCRDHPRFLRVAPVVVVRSTRLFASQPSSAPTEDARVPHMGRRAPRRRPQTRR